MTGRPWENTCPPIEPPSMTFTTLKKATCECGWSIIRPFTAPGDFTAEWEAHLAACPWPDMPDPVEVPGD